MWIQTMSKITYHEGCHGKAEHTLKTADNWNSVLINLFYFHPYRYIVSLELSIKISQYIEGGIKN